MFTMPEKVKKKGWQVYNSVKQSLKKKGRENEILEILCLEKVKETINEFAKLEISPEMRPIHSSEFVYCWWSEFCWLLLNDAGSSLFSHSPYNSSSWIKKYNEIYWKNILFTLDLSVSICYDICSISCNEMIIWLLHVIGLILHVN